MIRLSSIPPKMEFNSDLTCQLEGTIKLTPPKTQEISIIACSSNSTFNKFNSVPPNTFETFAPLKFFETMFLVTPPKMATESTNSSSE